MILPDQALYAPSNKRSESNEVLLAPEPSKQAVVDPIDYDTAILPSLLNLQNEYGETFADEDLPVAEAFAQRNALKQEMAVEYGEMISTAIETFHARTRCPTCNQTPITTNYSEMNHSLPKGAWSKWKDLCKKMEVQRPEVLDERDWKNLLGAMKEIEMWYWEDNTASVDCGRISWNGNLAPPPISCPVKDEGRIAVVLPKTGGPDQYDKAILRYGRLI